MAPRGGGQAQQGSPVRCDSAIFGPATVALNVRFWDQPIGGLTAALGRELSLEQVPTVHGYLRTNAARREHPLRCENPGRETVPVSRDAAVAAGTA